jgi:hypothetical protein
MKMIRPFSAQILEPVAGQRVVTFLTQAGYKQLSDSGGSLHFKRGSIIGTIFNFDPKKWACAVDVSLTSEPGSSEINVEAKITNDPFENSLAEELLTAEFNLLETACTAGEFNTFDAFDLRRRIAAYVYRVVGLFAGFIISAILGVIMGTFVLTKFAISTLAASAIGAGVFAILVAICLVMWTRQEGH